MGRRHKLGDDMIGTILITIMFGLLIWRCYIIEKNIHTIMTKHNELADIVTHNAEILNVVVTETNDIIEDLYGEGEEDGK